MQSGELTRSISALRIDRLRNQTKKHGEVLNRGTKGKIHRNRLSVVWFAISNFGWSEFRLSHWISELEWNVC